jgi:hypothetical protein
VDGLHGALETSGRAQLLEGQIIFFGEQGAQLGAVSAHDGGFAAGETMAWGNIAGASALLEEFLDQAQGDAETAGHLRACAFALVVGGQDSLAQIQGNGWHGRTLPDPRTNGYSFY